ncbi:hypothetical protein PB1_11379 [Bacillus methanolicus PB1]|uniref:Uncharacterized protein n=1 Tax=Bacillus methanolicus PB1 TaxID=997296 RepID=I3DV87_BACMT|nr:hypothetical protein PB1_11379 [Bacillus methanolicus PB1]
MVCLPQTNTIYRMVVSVFAGGSQTLQPRVFSKNKSIIKLRREKVFIIDEIF